MNEIVTVLKGVRELLTEESRWCKGWFAKDKDGHSIYSGSDDACQWCLMGAIKKVNLFQAPRVIGIIESVAGINLIRYNDFPKTTHQDILSLLDNTIDKLSLPQGKE